jgi:DNA-binding IclR family transcriptional regulator
MVAPLGQFNDVDVAVPSSGSSAIGKAARLLRALARAERGEAGVTELALASGLPKSTVHRVLSELILEDMVARMGSRYQLGASWHALQMTRHASDWGGLLDAARVPLAQAFEASGATVHLAVLESSEVLYLEKLTGRGGTGVPTRVGSRLPASCTALGKALLAHSEIPIVRSVLSKTLPRCSARSIVLPRVLLEQLAEVRKQGVAYDFEELQPGLFCVAVPVIQQGRPVAAVSLTRVGWRSSVASDREHAARAAREIAFALSSPD